jgi:hypothetical protein
VVARQQNQRHQNFNASLLPSGQYCGHGRVAIFDNQSRALWRSTFSRTEESIRNKTKAEKSIFIYGTTFKKNKFIPRFSASPNLFYRSQKQKKNYGSHPVKSKKKKINCF